MSSSLPCMKIHAKIEELIEISYKSVCNPHTNLGHFKTLKGMYNKGQLMFQLQKYMAKCWMLKSLYSCIMNVGLTT